MPSTSSRGRARPAAPSSPRRPLGRGFAPPAAPARPLEAPFAAAFGVLVAAEYLYLAWLLWEPDSGLDWFVAVPALFAAAGVAGAVLVVRGRGRGWVVLTVTAVVLLLGLLALVLLFGALGGGAALWQSLLLLIGPIGCLALTLRRPVREWTSPNRGHRPAGGRRPAGRAR
jgi:peptidoglycan/LPS O-acetylase OafA/YrhL